MMNYKNFIYLFFFIFLANCSANTLNIQKKSFKLKNNFINKGFTLIYSNELFNKRLISKKLEQRSLIIFQRNLKEDSIVKITNLLNQKNIIAKVGKNSSYPLFNNSVISPRIAKELNINVNEPYVEIFSLQLDTMFIAKKAKTYDEEKQVANKVPIQSISINNLNTKKLDKKPALNKKFSYIIKIADFYYEQTALVMKERITKETNIKKVNIKKISSNRYRVYLGSYNNIITLQNSFNDISILEFENIEIIKND